MNKRIDLTEGNITEKLVKLALPIMGTSFIQMAYNMIDMIWVGKEGSNAELQQLELQDFIHGLQWLS